MIRKETASGYNLMQEYTVLKAVKKHPFYSVDKLTKELPDLGRGLIQKILEENNLSTIETRLAFSKNKKSVVMLISLQSKMGIFRLLRFLQTQKIISGRVKGKTYDILRKLAQNPLLHRLNLPLVKTAALIAALAGVIVYGSNFIIAKPPKIALEQPAINYSNEGEKLFVSGKVVPADSNVSVNSNKVALNGDGSFTAIINIPMGETRLEVRAKRFGKESSILRLVNRTPTKEELAAIQDQQEKARKETVDKVAKMEGTINDLLAAKNASNQQKGALRIINNHVNQEANFSSIVGEVVNYGSVDAGWVMITAKFYDQVEQIVDTKYGFATDFNEIIKPGATAKFETQATTKPFDHYDLDLTWEEAKVGGVATEAAKVKEQQPTPTLTEAESVESRPSE